MSDDELHRFTLRLPSDLLQKVNEAAENSKRSATAEIVARLEASFGDLVPRKDLEDAEHASSVFFNTIIKLATDKDHPLVKRFGQNMTLLELDQLIAEAGKEPPIFPSRKIKND